MVRVGEEVLHAPKTDVADLHHFINHTNNFLHKLERSIVVRNSLQCMVNMHYSETTPHWSHIVCENWVIGRSCDVFVFRFVICV